MSLFLGLEIYISQKISIPKIPPKKVETKCKKKKNIIQKTNPLIIVVRDINTTISKRKKTKIIPQFIMFSKQKKFS
jgi:hypothetical protein